MNASATYSYGDSAADILHREHRRSDTLDLVRAVAIVMVMIDHGMRGDRSAAVERLTDVIFAPDAPLFFMLSGALLMPVLTGYRDFIKRRAIRVFVPFVVWACIYAVIHYSNGLTDAATMLHQIRWSPLIITTYEGWFIPVLISLYLFIPILSPFVATASRRHLEYFMLLWLASGTMPWLTDLEGFSSEWTVFHAFIDYTGWLIAGYYIMRYPLRPVLTPFGIEQTASSSRVNRLRIISMVVLGIVVPLAVAWHPGPMHIDKLIGDNYSICTMAMGCLIFASVISVRRVGDAWRPVVRLLSRNCYGMYLCHTAIAIWVVPRICPQLGDTSWMALILPVSALVVSEVLRRIPLIGRWLT